MARQQDWTRDLLLAAALLAATWAFVFLRQRRREARPVYLAPTPACGDDEPATPRQTAGPFFKANTPVRTSLIEPGIEGERVILEGYVVSTRCRPVAGARIELWHAGRRGHYDLFGYRLRGHQDTDAAGRYRFETIMPGSYAVRTRHYHIKVQVPGRPALTTQLYFPGKWRNRWDVFFRRRLLMDIDDKPDGKRARYDFVLDLP